MNKEPLKDKKRSINFYKENLNIAIADFYYWKDVKSAVEWLEEEMQLRLHQFPEDLKWINKLIDEAFEDVKGERDRK